MPCCTGWKLPLPHSLPPSLSTAGAANSSLIWLLPPYSPAIPQQEESFKNTTWIMKYFIRRGCTGDTCKVFTVIWQVLMGPLPNLRNRTSRSLQGLPSPVAHPSSCDLSGHHCTAFCIYHSFSLWFIAFLCIPMWHCLFLHVWTSYKWNHTCFFFTMHYVHETHSGWYM